MARALLEGMILRFMWGNMGRKIYQAVMSTRDFAIYCLRRMGGNDTLLYVLCNSSTKTHPLICFFLLFVFAPFYIISLILDMLHCSYALAFSALF